jgi:hypothetical protein
MTTQGAFERVEPAPVRVKVRLTNTFHGSSVRLVGELIGGPEETHDGLAQVRISDAQCRRARRELCGVEGCLCSRHGPHFEPEGNPHNRPTWQVGGEPV